MRGAAYDPGSKLFYCLFENRNYSYTTSDFQSFQRHAYLPIYPGLCPLVLIPGKCFAFVDNLLVLKDLRPVEEEEPLRILSGTPLDERFLTAHPEIPVQFTLNYFTAEKLFAEHMIQGRDDYDLYELRVSDVFLQMKEKGFFHALSGVAGYQEQSGSLYPVFRDLVTDDTGRLAAYPSSIMQTCFGISRWAAGQLGISPDKLPVSYAEFLDFAEAWEENPQEILLYNEGVDHLRMVLMKGVTDAFEALYFQNPQEALAALDETAALLDRIAALNLEKRFGRLVPPDNSAAMSDYTKEPDYLFTSNYSILPSRQVRSGGEWTAGFDYLPLKLTYGAPVVLPVTELRVYVINPYSSRISQAETYLSYLAKVRPPAQSAVFYEGDWFQESDYYRSYLLNEARHDIRRLTEYLPKAPEENRRDIQAEIQAAEDLLAYYEDLRHEVTPERVEAYAQRLPALALPALAAPRADTSGLYARLRQGQIDGKTYLEGFLLAAEKIRLEFY